LNQPDEHYNHVEFPPFKHPNESKSGAGKEYEANKRMEQVVAQCHPANCCEPIFEPWPHFTLAKQHD
jgi:hypothetical protein